ncbi:YitT family protein [Lederbergia citrea]|uniref:YitT family protein n=1 Tax=Lederbergia citrea TaxID=2833581 RepID=A0A942UQU6_9BACI|nr:YitT family protein [Lederbergia citrea]MBS4177418.1 YitT family protein [Lederbergia citrea]MBS4204096.1 YitT family protein [Lederbergia citrea]MBS4221319.1 YitT family protein [Lederbergia citrea]
MKLKQISFREQIKLIAAIILGAFLTALSLNFFLIPANVYASGFAGAAQLISNLLSDYTPIQISTGILLLLFNIPVAILGWMKVGKSFTLYSFITVLLTTFFLEILPVQPHTADILLYSVFGGVIGAVGIGITLKMGASTGGLDIVAMVLSRMNDRPVGTYFFIINAIIIITAGAIYGWDKALYTLVSLYASTRVIDAIHTRHQKLTAMIVTKKTSELKEAIHSRMVRGITVVPARGAFSNDQNEMMIIVITRYELYDLEHIIKEVDPYAFTNIVQTTEVFGFFRKE